MTPLLLGIPTRPHAQEPMVEEVRAAIRQYDAALRRSDVAALERTAERRARGRAALVAGVAGAAAWTLARRDG